MYNHKLFVLNYYLSNYIVHLTEGNDLKNAYFSSLEKPADSCFNWTLSSLAAEGSSQVRDYDEVGDNCPSLISNLY